MKALLKKTLILSLLIAPASYSAQAAVILCGQRVDIVADVNPGTGVGHVVQSFMEEGAKVKVCAIGNRTVVVGIYQDGTSNALIFSK